MYRPNCTRRPYALARHDIHDGDVLLFGLRMRWYLPWDWWTLLIPFVTEHWCVHAGMAMRLRNGLYCVQQSTEDHHKRLSEMVRQYPGTIHVYRWKASQPPHNTREWHRRAANRMLRLSGKRYGWLNLFRLAFRYLPIARVLLPKDGDDRELSHFPPFCAEAVSEAVRVGGGVDLVPDKPDRWTTPRDLAESPLLQYQFTLI